MAGYTGSRFGEEISAKPNEFTDGSGGNDTIRGEFYENETLIGGTGDDRIELDQHITGYNPSSISVDGGSGRDTLAFELYDHGFILNFDLQKFINTFDIVRVERFEVKASSGFTNQSLYGSKFDDVITSGEYGWPSYTNGRDGNDTIIINSDEGSYSEARGGSGNDTITGYKADDLIFGDNQSDLLSGGSGSDSLNGGRGNDTLDGGSGSDKIDGGVGNDVIYGNQSDYLNTNDHDMIFGGAGNDRIYAGAVASELSGGAGRDTFYFGGLYGGSVTSEHISAITDFVSGQDRISIDLTRYLGYDDSGQFLKGWYPDAFEPGRLDADRFVTKPDKMKDAEGYVIYSKGRIFYDADGTGEEEKILLVVLDHKPILNASDIYFV